MKTKPYEKPISAELAALIKKAIAYTKEKYGDTTYIFVDEKNPSRPMPYTTVQFRITDISVKGPDTEKLVLALYREYKV